MERADNLRFKGLAQPGSININSAGSMSACQMLSYSTTLDRAGLSRFS